MKRREFVGGLIAASAAAAVSVDEWSLWNETAYPMDPEAYAPIWVWNINHWLRCTWPDIRKGRVYLIKWPEGWPQWAREAEPEHGFIGLAGSDAYHIATTGRDRKPVCGATFEEDMPRVQIQRMLDKARLVSA